MEQDLKIAIECGKLQERNKNLEMKLESQIKQNETLRKQNSKLDYVVSIIRRCAVPRPEMRGWFVDERRLSMHPGDLDIFKELTNA